MTLETHEVLRAALDTLRSKGWTTHTREDRHGQHCVVGAVQHALFGRVSRSVSTCAEWGWVEQHPATKLAAEVIIEQFPERVSPLPLAAYFRVVTFNDNPNTTFADVEAVLEKAIVKAEEQAWS